MNLIVQEGIRSAFLLTDTAAVRTRNAAVKSFGPKVATIRIGGVDVGALACSGRLVPSDLFDQLRTIQASDLKAFRDRLPGALRALDRAYAERGEQGPMALIFASFDTGRAKAEGHGIATFMGLFPPSHKPFEVRSLSQHVTEFDPNLGDRRQTNFLDHSEWDAQRDSASLIEAQRQDASVVGGCLTAFTVGGQAILTRVNREGVSHHLIKTWPDRIGRRINPSRRASIFDVLRRGPGRDMPNIPLVEMGGSI